MDDKQLEHQPLLRQNGDEDVSIYRGRSFRSWKVKGPILVIGLVAVVATLATVISLSGRTRDDQSSSPGHASTVLQTQTKVDSNPAKYTGYNVLSVEVNDGKRQSFKDIVQQMNLDVWSEASMPGGEVLVGVAEAGVDTAQNLLHTAGLDWTVHTDNLQAVLDDEQKAIADRLKQTAIPGEQPYMYDNYNTFDQTQMELRRLANHCPDGFTCDLFSIGQSYENNDLTVLHISKHGTSNKAVWLDSLIHCREWITGATLMNIVRRMVTGYGQEPTLTKLMDNYDWYFLPVMNPDGYIHTWTTDRLWRQNRQPNAGSDCVGTDLNRNYEFMWGGVGASPDPCNNEYRGDHAASAPETRHVQQIIDKIGGNVLAWVTLHSCAQKWLIPWAFTEERRPDKCAYSPDYVDLLAVAEKATKALDDTNGQNFTAGNWCQAMYASSGVLQDHVKAIGDVKYAYTLELRGGKECFVVDPKEITASAKEVYNGLVAMVEAIEDLPLDDKEVKSNADKI